MVSIATTMRPLFRSRNSRQCPGLTSMAKILGTVSVALLIFGLWTRSESSRIKPQLVKYVATNFTEPYTFTNHIEGPAVDFKGNFYAVNYAEDGTIGKASRFGRLSLFARLPAGSVGNGIRFNEEGEMFVADAEGKSIIRINKNGKSVTTFAQHPKMHAPNDLAITTRGILFATDPNFENNNGSLWRIMPDGDVTVLEEGLGTTNGVEVNPEETILYVGESAEQRVLAYDLSPSGVLSNKRVFLAMNETNLYLDGIRCDVEGNLYIALYNRGAVLKVSPQGEVLKRIHLVGDKVANVAFGGHDGCTIFATVRDSGNVQSFRVELPGRSYYMWLPRKHRKSKKCLY
ncbi:hypothetical protein BSKO_02914 [Bryopsis sp. KO-2023]|nr:hypothetical protein BSKO_02914 [Bryopsis sp. KO-2023]